MGGGVGDGTGYPHGDGSPDGLSAVVRRINAAHGTSFRLVGRYSLGEQGAFRLLDAADGRFVLKWAPGAAGLGRLPRIVAALDRLRAGARWVDHGLLFTTRYGTPLDGNNLRRRFRALLGEAGVPEPGGLRFHDLRHTGVSALIAAGVPVPEVAAIAGHATPAVTNQLYAHAVRRARGHGAGRGRRLPPSAARRAGRPGRPREPPTPWRSPVSRRTDAAGGADGAAERAEAAERPGPEGP